MSIVKHYLSSTRLVGLCWCLWCNMQEGMLPLHFAAWFNRLDVAALLLDRGSQINPPTKVSTYAQKHTGKFCN